MKASLEKSHILPGNKKTEKVTINVIALTSSVEGKLLVTKPVIKYIFCPELQATCC